jgi:hypothetical protein
MLNAFVPGKRRDDPPHFIHRCQSLPDRQAAIGFNQSAQPFLIRRKLELKIHKSTPNMKSVATVSTGRTDEHRILQSLLCNRDGSDLSCGARVRSPTEDPGQLHLRIHHQTEPGRNQNECEHR